MMPIDFSQIITAQAKAAKALADAKEAALTRVLAWSAEQSAPLTNGLSQEEIMSFPVKAPAAEAYLDGRATALQMQMLQAEASITQETLQALCSVILAKSGPYMIGSGVIAGVRRAVEAGLQNAKTPADCVRIVDEVLARATPGLENASKGVRSNV